MTLDDGDDTTGHLRRSGVMLVTLPEDPEGKPIELRFRAKGDALMPRLLRISVNALPVVQRVLLPMQSFTGTGRPGQTLTFDPQSCLPVDEPAPDQVWRLTRDAQALRVRVAIGGEFSDWRPGTLAEASADSAWYEVDERTDGRGISICFGNGVNGARVPEGAPITVSAELSAGAKGTVRSSLEWRLDGQGTLWRNREPIDGGEDAHSPEDLLRQLRARLRDERPLVSSAQIVEAARALSPAYGIDRAFVEEGWEPGRRRPATPATRTLLVTRDPRSSETGAWLRAIRGEILPRMLIGEQLIVAEPKWRTFGVRIRVLAAPRSLPREVERAIRDFLAAKLPPGDFSGPGWPLGRDVTASELGGWIRRIEGVAALSEAVLLDQNGRLIETGLLRIGRGALPRLDESMTDVKVIAGGGR